MVLRLLGRTPTQPRSPARSPTFFRLTMLAWLAVLALGALAGCAFRPRPPDLATQITEAHTPADHAAIARALLAKASEYTSAAAYHRGLTAKYETLAGPGAQYRSYDRSDLRMVEHCRNVAEDLERAANELTELAHEHERLAGPPQGEQQ